MDVSKAVNISPEPFLALRGFECRLGKMQRSFSWRDTMARAVRTVPAIFAADSASKEHTAVVELLVWCGDKIT